MHKRAVLYLVLSFLVVTEVAILVPVIISQRAQDEAESKKQLEALSDDFALRVNTTINTFIYNVVRTSGAALVARGFFSQEQLRSSLRLDASPSLYSRIFVWVPRVFFEEKDSYEQFYGFGLTEFNGSAFVPVKKRDVYYPFTLFEPLTPSFDYLNGFDLLSNAGTTSTYLKNVSLHLVSHSSFNQTSPNNFGIVVVSRESFGKGYAMGIANVEQVLEASLTINRRDVVLAVYDESVTAPLQLLFLDNSPLLTNATTVARFGALPARSEFVVRKVVVLGDTVLICMRYSDALHDSFVGSTWIILVAVLVPVSIAFNAVVVVLLVVWQNRLHRQKLEQRKRERSQIMLGYVNHEIRNPLQTILGVADIFVEELEEGGNSSENTRLLQDVGTIARAAEFIEHIASDVLDIHRIEEGKILLEHAPLDVKLLILGLERAVLPLSKPNVVFRVVCDPNLDMITTDRYRLEQILMNFLTNAYKHTENGAIVLSFSFVNSGLLRMSVADTGKGIPEDLKKRMFQQFGQISASDASKLGGFGLGLFLTKILATLLGGSVGFESTFGAGSIFWLDLPMEKTPNTLELQFDESSVLLKQ